MNKRINTLLLFLMTFSFFLIYTGCNGGNKKDDSGPVNIFKFETSGSEAKITGLVETTDIPADIIIPSSIDNYTVTAIGDEAFKDWTTIKSITIPASITAIGENVFSGCKGLSKISVDKTNSCFTEINWVLFSKDMTRLICYPPGKAGSSYIIPTSVTTIGSSAFNSCAALTTITISTVGVTTIGSYAFYGCTNLTNITLPSGITSIENCTFSFCSSLTDINIPLNVTTIGNYAFNGCSKLKSINSSADPTTLPEVLTYIGHDAFRDCVKLPSITIPDTVTYIGYDAFNGCTELAGVNIPAGITRIDTRTFASCPALTTLTIPSTIKSIDDSSFKGCTGLTSVTIPSGVTFINSNSFSMCTGLTEILVESGNTSYVSDGGVLFNFDKTELLTYPAGKSGNSYTIPAGVKIICVNAFSGSSLLQAITLPDSVTSISWEAFSGCSGLLNLTIPLNVSEIYDTAFKGCTSLAVLTINAVTPPAILPPGQTKVSFLSDCSLLSTITVPAGCSTAYLSSYGWSGFLTLIME